MVLIQIKQYKTKSMKTEIIKILKSANFICFDDYYSLDYIVQYCVKGVFGVRKYINMSFKLVSILWGDGKGHNIRVWNDKVVDNSVPDCILHHSKFGYLFSLYSKQTEISTLLDRDIPLEYNLLHFINSINSDLCRISLDSFAYLFGLISYSDGATL